MKPHTFVSFNTARWVSTFTISSFTTDQPAHSLIPKTNQLFQACQLWPRTSGKTDKHHSGLIHPILFFFTYNLVSSLCSWRLSQDKGHAMLFSGVKTGAVSQKKFNKMTKRGNVRLAISSHMSSDNHGPQQVLRGHTQTHVCMHMHTRHKQAHVGNAWIKADNECADLFAWESP